jgi:hypothetical protein
MAAISPDAPPDHGAVTLTGDPVTGKVSAAPADGGSTLPLPDDQTTDFIWRVVVLTACAIALVAGVAIVVAMFIPASGKVTPPEVTIIFTLVFGFLSGLLANKARSTNG